MQQTFSISNIKKNKEYIIFLFLIFATRLPFASKILYSWDAVQFSLALEKFNLGQHQPHPPGYILYVGLGKVINFFIADPNYTYIIISILASFIITILFYKFCKLLFNNKQFAFLSTLILIFIPYFWYYGEVASSYIFDGLFSILFAYLALLVIKRQQTKYFLLFSFFLGISGGFRQSLIILFLPLWFFVFFILIKTKKIAIKQIFLNIIVFPASILIWFVPLIFLSAGWKNYWEVTNWLYLHAAINTSIFQEASLEFIWSNFKNIIKVNLTILNILAVSPFFLLLSKPNLRKFISQKNTISLFVFWFVPSLFLYIFVHFGNTGYLMTIILGLILIFLTPLYLICEKYGLKKILLISIILISISTSSFLLLNSNTFNNRYKTALENRIKKFDIWYYRYTYGDLKNFDKKIETIVAEIKKYDPQKTILVCGNGFKYRPTGSEQYFSASYDYFRHLEFYLPEYNLYELFYADRLQYFHIKNKSPLEINYSNKISINSSIEKILIISDDMDRELISQNSIQKIDLENNQKIFFVNAENKAEITYWQYKFVKDTK